jgi:hypothetical protein
MPQNLKNIQTLKKRSNDPLDIYSVTIMRGNATNKNRLRFEEVI